MMAMSSLSIFVLTFFMQELPIEVKEDYLRRAILMTHSKEQLIEHVCHAAGHHPVGHHHLDQNAFRLE